MVGRSCDNGRKVRMTITVRPEHEKLIAQPIVTGAYKNPDEVIERAFGQFDRGEFFSAEERSEERRVGKECRSRGSPYHLKKTERANAGLWQRMREATNRSLVKETRAAY